MRLFLALNLPDRLRHDIWQATAELRDAGPGIKWVDADRLHITLKFLGEQDESVLPRLLAAMQAVGANHAAPMIHLGGIGAFPTFRKARVVWMGIVPGPQLELLHHDVETACEQLGHDLEGKPFRPHLSLGRLKERLDDGALRALRNAARKVRFSDAFHATTIDMMRSTTSPERSRYTTVAIAPMRIR